MPDIRIIIEGKNAHSAANRLAEVIGKDLGYQPNIAKAAANQVDTKVDPGTIALGVSIAALVINIPGAFLNILKLSDRLKKNKQAEAIIKAARELRELDNDLVISVSSKNGSAVSLDRMDPSDLVDMAID